jgi:primosomal protein N' (replication factor Y) (superfamily II helicase)
MFASVALSTVPRPLTYSIPSHLHVAVGAHVLVPLRGRKETGVVTAMSDSCPYDGVRDLLEVVSQPLSPELMKLVQWVADYYCAPLSATMRAALPGSVRRQTAEKKQLFVHRAKSRKELTDLCISVRSRAPAQARALESLLVATKGLLLTELLDQSDTSRSTISALEKRGAVRLTEVTIDRSPLDDHPYFPTLPKKLTGEQQQALDIILDSLRTFQVHLLHGVTGSGKTEVYLQAIEKVLAAGGSALVLVPEIALTGQTIERFRSRFEGKIAALHHRLSDGERADAWRQLASGEIQIAIAARSGIFAPMKNLGLIVVDEEHEPSYKQTDAQPCYHARDAAVMRGKFAGCPVILGSATPSLESYTNAKKGKYRLIELLERPAGALLPTVDIVDMRAACDRAGRLTLLSDKLLGEIEKRYKAGEQSLLFLNRRGYHSLLMCRKCSEPISCPHCDLTLTFHKHRNILSCHLCSHEMRPPRHCPKCRGDEPMLFRGAGTEQVESALHAILPDLRILRVDADTTRHKGSHEQLLRQFRSGKADVLVGTQMIAKGLHFPQVTLVGVLSSDPALQIPDFRASERAFQLLTQVAGRAGRGDTPGKVLLQSWMPDSRILHLAAAQDYGSFYEEEIGMREQFGFPPAAHLAKLTFSGEDEALTRSEAERCQAQAGGMPVTPCGYAKVKDRFRFQFLVRGSRLQPLLKSLRTAPKVSLHIDVDPLSTYY